MLSSRALLFFVRCLFQRLFRHLRHWNKVILTSCLTPLLLLFWNGSEVEHIFWVDLIPKRTVSAERYEQQAGWYNSLFVSVHYFVLKCCGTSFWFPACEKYYSTSWQRSPCCDNISSDGPKYRSFKQFRVWPFTSHWLLYVPPALTNDNFVVLYMAFVWISE
jgi:hypothetical protein